MGKLVMLLVVDAGNSMVKWATWQGKRWQGHAAVPHGSDLPGLRERALAASACAVSCVSKAPERAVLERELAAVPTTWIRALANAPGVANHYDPPESLGADRWCALLALRKRCGHGTAVLAGTAVTVDSLAEDGVFRGGLVLPGRRLMHHALAAATPLRPPEPTPQDQLPHPGATTTAVLAGCLHAVAGAIHLFLTSRGTLAQPILVAGGDAPAVAQLVPGAELVPDLVLDGLRIAQGTA